MSCKGRPVENRISNIDYFRGILVIMVMLFHFMLIVAEEQYYALTTQALLIANGSFGVAGVFVLSGFLLTKKWTRNKTSVLAAVLERTIRLLVPLLASYFLLLFVFELGAGPFARFSSQSGYDFGMIKPIGMLDTINLEIIFISFVNQLSGYNDNLLLVAWTMYHEFKSMLVVLAIISISRLVNFPLDSIKAVFLTSSMWLVFFIFHQDEKGLINAFALGSILAQMYMIGWFAKAKINIKKHFRICMILWIMCLVTLYITVFFANIINIQDIFALGVKGKDSYPHYLFMYLLTDLKYFLYAIFMLVASPLIVMLVSRIATFRKAIQNLSRISFSAYLIHQHVLMIILYLLQFIPENGQVHVFMHIPWYLVLPIYLILTILISEIFYSLIERPSHMVARWVENKMDKTALDLEIKSESFVVIAKGIN